MELRTTALSRDLGNGTTEIHVEMIDAPFVDQPFHRFGDVIRIPSVRVAGSAAIHQVRSRQA